MGGPPVLRVVTGEKPMPSDPAQQPLGHSRLLLGGALRAPGAVVTARRPGDLPPGGMLTYGGSPTPSAALTRSGITSSGSDADFRRPGIGPSRSALAATLECAHGSRPTAASVPNSSRRAPRHEPSQLQRAPLNHPVCITRTSASGGTGLVISGTSARAMTRAAGSLSRTDAAGAGPALVEQILPSFPTNVRRSPAQT